MALRRNNPTEAVVTPTNTEAPAAPVAPVAPAQPPAVRAAAAPVAFKGSGGQLVLLFDDVKDNFVADFGVLPRLKASNGSVLDQDDRQLGRWIETQIVSWNKRWVVGPHDNKAPSELVRYSLDNAQFDDGTGLTVEQHIANLKSDGWANAASKEYYEVVVMLLAAEMPTTYVGEMVQLQLSPTSRKAFDGFRLQQSFKLSQGLISPEQAALVRFEPVIASNKGNNWTKLEAKRTQMAV